MDQSLTPEELAQAARGINAVLADLGYPEQKLNDWWNLVAWPELGDKTPTRAWLDGNTGGVERLVRSIHERNANAARRTADDPQLMDSLRKRRAVLSRGHS